MKDFTVKRRQYNVVNTKTRRPLKFVALGFLLVGLAALLIMISQQSRSSITPKSESYNYSIEQSAIVLPQYRKSSFFGATPDTTNTAFLTDLTDTIEAQFQYNFKASEATDLRYSYQASSKIHSLYGSDKSTANGQATVWSKQFTLLPPVQKVQHSAYLTINPTISIPFANYYKQMEQFRNAYSAPLSSELVVTYVVHLTGNVHGTPLKEDKTSTITIPLDQQIYKISSQYDKTTQHSLALGKTKSLKDIIAKAELPLAVVVLLLGLVSTAYGLRKQLIKSPYQRKLEKIYRYHDGIIIRAKQPPDLSNKNIVDITSFEDMLNLEEELKTPIIASKVNDYTTHFFISRDDIVYVFTLGVPTPLREKQ
jgi:hypothetical protein